MNRLLYQLISMQALFHENEQLRKELEKLAAENKSLKEK